MRNHEGNWVPIAPRTDVAKGLGQARLPHPEGLSSVLFKETLQPPSSPICSLLF